MSTSDPAEIGPNLELWHPIYLDSDMSMAFAAALAGGVALELESVDRDAHVSEAVRNIRGNLRLFDLLGFGADRERRSSDSGATESRMVRHHTESSVFIALYDELRRTGRIAEPNVETLHAGDIVSLELSPATVPLRRVVDQIIRLLDIMDPQATADETSSGNRKASQQGGRVTPKTPPPKDAPDNFRPVFKALRDDLDRSGMTDVVVRREGQPSVILTLDNRIVTTQALELMQTSTFTVVGKVSQIWPGSDDVVDLFRRSVLSLAPSLAQMVAWSFMSFMTSLATSIDSYQMQRTAMAAVGIELPEEPEEPREVRFGDISSLLPAVSGPAIQILPLAVCA